MSRITALILMSFCPPCSHLPRYRIEPTPPPTNHDASCLPAGAPPQSSARLQAQADMLKTLIKATEETDPDMPDLLLRLAEHHFQGGFVSAGCKIADFAIELGDADDIAKATQLRMQSCFDARIARCTAWYEPS
ncbi:MAG TPA: hypothetical protein VG755_26280 [Nannocystaceae bacterium]|nr:hypothetical protein [Nannocystaceae bacterium]